jgi:hypothetical protein
LHSNPQGKATSKAQASGQYLQKVEKTRLSNKIGQVKSQMKKDLTSAVEMSQMSQWSTDAKKPALPNVINDRLRQRDKEDLLFELNSHKEQNHVYLEEIKLLKTEIVKLRKAGPKPPGGRTNNWMLNQDANTLKPTDTEGLSHQIKGLKKQLNEQTEEIKQLKSLNN